MATLSPEAAQYGDEIGKMVNNMLLQTNFLQLAKAAAPLVVPLSKGGVTSSGANGEKKESGETPVDDASFQAAMAGRVDKRPASEDVPPTEKDKNKVKTQDEINADEANKF